MSYSNAAGGTGDGKLDEELCDVGCAKFGVALSWDKGAKNVDVDLQGIVFDDKGKLVDAVYYNNMKAVGKALTHSGDEIDGAKGGYDEVVWVQMPKLPPTVAIIAFVTSCYTGGHLNDAKNGQVHLLEDKALPANELAKFRLEDSDEEVDLVGALIKSSSGQWKFYKIEEPAADGQHFMDILEPTIGSLVRRWIPSAPRRIKASFAMEKGMVVDLPKSDKIGAVSAALGWDASDDTVDLDVSALLLDKNNTLVETVFFGNEEAQGVKHSGDNLTGEGDGDDEEIVVDLQAVGANIEQIVFTINVYTKGKNFSQVQQPYCRVVTSTGDEICKYMLNDAGTSPGLIITRLFREPGDRWGFQALGIPCKGNTFKDAVPEVLKLAALSPKEVAH